MTAQRSFGRRLAATAVAMWRGPAAEPPVGATPPNPPNRPVLRIVAEGLAVGGVTGLVGAGGMIVESCQGCHQAFKPDSPTEGIMHIPHYED